jgi:hypothetical protein
MHDIFDIWGQDIWGQSKNKTSVYGLFTLTQNIAIIGTNRHQYISTASSPPF